MNNKSLLEEVKTQRIGKAPVVVLPLKSWRAIEEKLEELETANSEFLRKKIAKARKEKSFYSSQAAKKMLGM